MPWPWWEVGVIRPEARAYHVKEVELAFLCDIDPRKGKSGDLFPGADGRLAGKSRESTLKLNFKGGWK